LKKSKKPKENPKKPDDFFNPQTDPDPDRKPTLSAKKTFVNWVKKTKILKRVGEGGVGGEEEGDL
jgi:hypothetical protein